MDEHTLVTRLKERDPAAFTILLQTYKNQVANICYRFLFNREDAEELSQEVFIAAYKGIPNFRGESKLSTWLYQLASSKSIDLIRRRKQKKRFAFLTNFMDLKEKGIEIPDPQSSDPMADLENEEKGRIIREAIDTLPTRYRRVFTLTKCDGFSNKEVAEIMDISQSAVELLVHRAKKKLRTLLYAAFEKEIEKFSKKVKTKPGNSVSTSGKAFLLMLICWLLSLLD